MLHLYHVLVHVSILNSSASRKPLGNRSVFIRDQLVVQSARRVDKCIDTIFEHQIYWLSINTCTKIGRFAFC